MRKSYIINVSRVETSPSADRLRGVPVAICGVTAGFANESSPAKSEAGLVSRTTLTAGHRREKRWNESHRTPSGIRKCKQNLFGHTDSAVGCLFRHRCRRKKSGFEVFDGDSAKGYDNLSSPFERAVFALPCDLDVDAGHALLGIRSPNRSRLGAGQLALRPSQLLGVVCDLISTRKVEVWIGCGCNSLHSPIDSDGVFGWRKGFPVAADNERDVPVTFSVPRNDTGLRNARKFPTPDDRNAYSTDEVKRSVSNSERFCRVFKRWAVCFSALESWKSKPRSLESPLIGGMPFSHSLLLNALGTLVKPIKLRSPLREFFAQSAVCWRFVRDSILEQFVGFFSRFDAFVPNPASAVPFKCKAGFGDASRAQSEGVSDGGLVLAHAKRSFGLRHTSIRKTWLKSVVPI